MKKLTFFILFLFIGCTDSSINNNPQVDPDTGRNILIQDQKIETLPDVYIIDFTLPDLYVDPCLNITSSSENFCDCQPQCCQTQQWYCPPSGLGVNALDIVMNVCDENFVPCDRSQNFNCPPNEVIFQGSCR